LTPFRTLKTLKHVAEVGIFPATHWSLVVAAGNGNAPEADAALERLCTSYREPVIRYLRSLPLDPNCVEDIAQGFFLSLIRRRSLSRVAPELGRFRSFLKAALRHHLIDHCRSLPEATLVALDALEVEERESLVIPEGSHPGDTLDRAWAEQVLHLAYLRLEACQQSEEEVRSFQILRRFLAENPAAGAYAALAATLQIEANTLAKRVQRLRHEFDRCVRAELLETVGTPSEVEREIRALFA
jgi:DNA-directed RNA polymerase specialized sigma24 family protein